VFAILTMPDDCKRFVIRAWASGTASLIPKGSLVSINLDKRSPSAPTSDKNASDDAWFTASAACSSHFSLSSSPAR